MRRRLSFWSSLRRRRRGALLLSGAAFLLAGCGAPRRGGRALPVPRWLSLREGPSYRSVQGRPIPVDILGEGPVNLHFHAGIHGSEPEGVPLLERLEELLRSRPELAEGLRIVLVKKANPDGLARGSRFNAHGVDLNRNFPSRNWKPLPRGRSGKAPLSEPESRALADLFRRWPPALVVTLHAARRSVNWDGPCADLAARMAGRNGYRLESTVGYATPGSLGSWLGRDRGVPVITLELRRGSPRELWEENRDALLEAVRWARRRGLSPGLPPPAAGTGGKTSG